MENESSGLMSKQFADDIVSIQLNGNTHLRDPFISDLNKYLQNPTNISIFEEVFENLIVLKNDLSTEIIAKIEKFIKDNPKYKEIRVVRKESIQQRKRVISEGTNRTIDNINIPCEKEGLTIP